MPRPEIASSNLQRFIMFCLPLVLCMTTSGMALANSWQRTRVFFDDFNDGDTTDWHYDDTWQLTSTEHSSAPYSFGLPNDHTTKGNGWWLVSPLISLPELQSNEALSYGFSLYLDAPDSYNSTDRILNDCYAVFIKHRPPPKWHLVTLPGRGRLYSCSHANNDGYGGGWFQYLDTPALRIPHEGATLTADLKWSLRTYNDEVEDILGIDTTTGCPDGSDQINVQISTDGGATFSLLESQQDPYELLCGDGSSVAYQNHYLPGWGGSRDWHTTAFDLNAYAGQNVVIRFAFYSSFDGPGPLSLDNLNLTGVYIDNIKLDAAAFLDTGDTCLPMGQMQPSGGVVTHLIADFDHAGFERVGSSGWEVRNRYATHAIGDGLQDLSTFAGQDIQLMFLGKYDEDDDGGTGSGMFFDDVYIDKEIRPSNLVLAPQATLPSHSAYVLSWDDLSDLPAQDNITYDVYHNEQLVASSHPTNSLERPSLDTTQRHVFKVIAKQTGPLLSSSLPSTTLTVEQDCNNIFGGAATLDPCGVCDSDPTNDTITCRQDCACTWAGDATIDQCGVCDDDPTNDNTTMPNGDLCIEDCAGILGGAASLDACGICQGDDSSCADCAGVPNGSSTVDACGICDDNHNNNNTTCEQDCLGVWNGANYQDSCGVCDAEPDNDNTTCEQDCLGVWGGTAYIDDCSQCDDNRLNDNTTCLQDCADVWGGTAHKDNCGVCDTDLGNNNTTCSQDCRGVWGGDAAIDNCGVCRGDNSTCSIGSGCGSTNPPPLSIVVIALAFWALIFKRRQYMT